MTLGRTADLLFKLLKLPGQLFYQSNIKNRKEAVFFLESKNLFRIPDLLLCVEAAEFNVSQLAK